MIPIRWTWRDLGRAIKAARWAFYHADDLAMLKHELMQEHGAGWDGMSRQQATRLRQWAARRYLGTLPIK
mgnify:CR=1 FL=1